MAVRALIPAERLNICHVNSNDGSSDYESGVAYMAGCVVTYNGSTYVANVDIEDTDTDTPDSAPEKWGVCPNARSLVEGGEMADLENRVSALELAVGDENSGLVKDVSDLEMAVGDENSGLVKDVSDLDTAVSKRITYAGLESATQLFDVLSDDTNYPPGTIYFSYANHIEVGTDAFHTLLGLSQYAHVEIGKIDKYLESIQVYSPGGNCAFAYASPDDPSIVFGIFTPSGNTSVTITKPV